MQTRKWEIVSVHDIGTITVEADYFDFEDGVAVFYDCTGKVAAFQGAISILKVEDETA